MSKDNGQEFDFIIIDEVVNVSPAQIRYLKERVNHGFYPDGGPITFPGISEENKKKLAQMEKTKMDICNLFALPAIFIEGCTRPITAVCKLKEGEILNVKK